MEVTIAHIAEVVLVRYALAETNALVAHLNLHHALVEHTQLLDKPAAQHVRAESIVQQLHVQLAVAPD